MIRRSGPTVATPVDVATDIPLSVPESVSTVDRAASFLTGGLLSRADARAGLGGLLPSDLSSNGVPPRAFTGFVICDITPPCRRLP